MNKIENQIPIQELISLLWKDRLLIILIVSFFSISSVIISLLIPNQYTASGVYQINEDESGSSLSALAGQFNGLAGMGGFAFPDSDKSDFAVQFLRSKDLLKKLLTYDGTREKLFAAKSYDFKEQRIIFHSSIYNEEKNAWVRKIKSNMNLIPSYIEIHKEVIEKQLSVSKDRQTGFISINFTHQSPVFAKYFLDLMVRELNLISRERDLQKSQYALNYLNDKLNEVTEAELRKSIIKMAEVELNKEMLTFVYEDYILAPIDSPVVPEKKSWPQRSLIVILLTFLGMLISFCTVFIKNAYFKNSD
jgi:uncharacterized protein involved in exopolysaccharide biosynthesis